MTEANQEIQACVRCGQPYETRCRICDCPLCHDCTASHWHESYGTPLTQSW